jgi:hypothetical protein
MKDSPVAAEAVKETANPIKDPARQREITSKKISSLLSFIGTILFRLRKLVLAAPVVYAALKLAFYNRENLPEQVGINIQSSGEFAQMITRDMAVMGPLGLTAACLLLMLCSRKALYPWAISVFTLVLPLLILFINLYPA